MKCRWILAFAALFLLVRGGASAQSSFPPLLVALDEYGNSAVFLDGEIVAQLDAFVGSDFGPGAIGIGLNYFVPVGVVEGDLILTEPDTNGDVSDVLRFTPLSEDASLITFYSDIDADSGASADFGLPTDYYSNQVTMVEEGTAYLNGTLYTPGPNDPGFIPISPFGISYLFISNGNLTTLLAPEPGSLALMAGMGVAGFGLLHKRRRRK